MVCSRHLGVDLGVEFGGVGSGCGIWVWDLGVGSGCGIWVWDLGVGSGCGIWVWTLGVESGCGLELHLGVGAGRSGLWVGVAYCCGI